jgi:hypothetical protein
MEFGWQDLRWLRYWLAKSYIALITATHGG